MKMYLIIAILFVTMPKIGSCQIPGDFQTKNAAGNWSDFNAWNIRSGGIWIAATAGQIPTTTSSVFVQTGQTINVDITTAFCNDLNFAATGTTLKVIVLANKILTIYGSLNQFDNTNDPFPGFGAKIVFAGSAPNQTITNSGLKTNLHNVEINKSAGTFTLPSGNLSYENFTLTSGTVLGSSGSSLVGISTSTVTINGGTWTQTIGASKIDGGSGVDAALVINTGTMTLGAASGTGFNFSSVNILNGGTLNLNNAMSAINVTNIFSIDATSILNTAMGTTPSGVTMSFLGTVNYNHTTTQNIINTTYNNLILSGVGNKNPLTNIIATGNLTISGSAVLPLGALTATIGGNWTNWGTGGFTESTSTIDFNGSGAQNLTTTGGEDFYILKKSGSGTLTLGSNVSVGGGGAAALNISNGTLNAGTFNLHGTGSTPLVMSGGILQLGQIAPTTQPDFSAANFSLSAGTIELNGSGLQILTGGPGSNYRGLKFSGTTSITLGASAPASITGTIYITGAAILDIANKTFGDINTSLTMDVNSRFRMSGTTTKPDIDGTYTLNGGTIEFYNNLGTAEKIKGKNGGGVGSPVIYKNIEVTGTNVGTSNDNIILNAIDGRFTVTGIGATFSISSPTIKSSNDLINNSKIIVTSNAIFKTGNNKGFSADTEGFAHNSAIHSNIAAANISLIAGSTVDYISPAGQDISNQIPYQNLTISATASTEKAPSGILTVQGDLVKSGASTFDANGGTVLLNGATQSFAGLTYNNLLIDNTGTKTLTANANIIDSISIGNITTNPATVLALANSDITLKSSSLKTARVGIVGLAAAISYGTGRFAVERYYPNANPLTHRAWRLVTAPLNATGDIYDTWQLSGAAWGVGNAHTGTLITGPNPGAVTGLDFTPTNNYSLKTYDGTSFIGISNTHIPVSPTIGTGYFLFVRGDRNPILTNVANNDFTTLRSKGTISTGNLSISANNPYSLIGNPYASPINFATLVKTNVYQYRFYIWDPNLNQVGGYVTMEDIGNTGNFIQTSPGGPSSQTKYIQSSQAFFVQNTGSSGSISFQESDKTAFNNNAIFRPMSGQDIKDDFISTNLYLLNADGSRNLADGNLAEFNERYSHTIDITDALKFGNINETFSLVRHNQKLAVERRPAIAENDTLVYHLSHTTQRNYQLELVANISTPGLAGYWEDSYTQTSTPVNVLGITVINFTVTSDAASAVANRFRLVFKNSNGPLPVTFSAITAFRKNNDIVVEWVVENEININSYEVEKSADGQHFTRVNTTAASGIIMYNWLDKNALPGDNFFRIKNIDNNGEGSYSSIVKIKFDNGEGGIAIYSNPVTDGIISLQLLNQPKGVYQFRLFDNLGQLIFSKSFNHVGETAVVPIKPGEGRLVTGTYHLQVVKPDSTMRHIKVFAQVK